MERNRENLRRAIDHLPEYQPPDELWHDLAEYLDFEEKLEAPLREMPVHTPPAAVWDALAARIEQAPELKPRPRPRTRSALPGLIGVLLLAGFVGWWMSRPDPAARHPPAAAPERPRPAEPIAQTPPNPEPVTPLPHSAPHRPPAPRRQPHTAHRTEVVDDVLILACQHADDPGYRLVETLCREALPVCEEPPFRQLKAELDDLTHAHSELRNALGNFADDPDLVAQLIEIEHARRQVLQQLMAML